DLAERSAKHREVLREHEDAAAEDRPVPGHDRISVRTALHHPEVPLAMAHEAVELDERAGVAEPHRSFPRQEAAPFAPLLHGARAPRVGSLLAELARPVELRACRDVRPVVSVVAHGRSRWTGYCQMPAGTGATVSVRRCGAGVD